MCACMHVYCYVQITLNSAYNEVTFNKKLAIMKENLPTKYTLFTYDDVALNKKPPIMKQNLHIFFVIGRVACKFEITVHAHIYIFMWCILVGYIQDGNWLYYLHEKGHTGLCSLVILVHL